MTLLRRVPPNIRASQQQKLVASPEVFRRQSPQSKLGTRFRSLYFQLGIAESKELSNEWARGYLLIQNQDMNLLYIEFGRPATPQSYSLGGGQEFKPDNVCPCNSINVYAPNGCYGVIIEG